MLKNDIAVNDVGHNLQRFTLTLTEYNDLKMMQKRMKPSRNVINTMQEEFKKPNKKDVLDHIPTVISNGPFQDSYRSVVFDGILFTEKFLQFVLTAERLQQ